MDCYLVDIQWLSEAFGGARIWNFDIKQQMAAHHLPFGERWEISNRLVTEIKRERWKMKWRWGDLNPGQSFGFVTFFGSQIFGGSLGFTKWQTKEKEAVA